MKERTKTKNQKKKRTAILENNFQFHHIYIVFNLKGGIIVVFKQTHIFQ
mgnify:CR=1 FL=1